MDMKKFIVSLFLYGCLSLAICSPLHETETVSGLTMQAGPVEGNAVPVSSGVLDNPFPLPLHTEKSRNTSSEKWKNTIATKKTGIAIVSFAGYVPDSDLQRGIDVLKARGYQVFNYVDPQKRYQIFGATDKERVRQINEAVANPDVQVIMASRGGYGTSRLLSRLDFDRFAKSGKLFVGFSDITAFEMALLKHGAISFSGPMVQSDYSLKEVSDFTLDHFDKTITSPKTTVNWSAKGNPDVDVEGTLWGGNLVTFSHLTGTEWLPDITGGILFFEDVHEHPYKIERMLIQLDEAGILKKQKALVLGHFTDYTIAESDNGYDFGAMLSWLRSRVSIPVLTGLPFGHVKDKVTLPVGAKAHLVSKDGHVQLDIRDYPTVK